MTETPEPRTERTAVEGAPTAPRDATAVGLYHQHSRLYALLAWVGIVAGIVFIVAVVFFSGFALGRHSGGHHHHWQGAGWSHHHGGQSMGPWRFPGGPGGPGGQFGPGGPGGPGGQFGPGNPYGPGGTQSPTTAPTTPTPAHP